jgi:DNA polymerase-3 subunit delta
VITSDEHLLALEAADKIRKAARAQGYSERDVLTVERSFKWGELLAANQALSLFGDKKLIELRIPTGKPGKDGGAALQNYVKDLSPDNLTLITLPKLDWQTQKAAWVRAAAGGGVYRHPAGGTGAFAQLDRPAPCRTRAERGPAEH